jgi:hypothetical protein
MTISTALGWLCKQPPQAIRFKRAPTKGWPGFADFVLLAKQLELGRGARWSNIVLGEIAAFIYYGGLPLGSPGKPGG